MNHNALERFAINIKQISNKQISNKQISNKQGYNLAKISTKFKVCKKFNWMLRLKIKSFLKNNIF